MPSTDARLINKARSAVALLLEESFGSKHSIGLPALCTSVEASLIEILKCFISATLECGTPQLRGNAFEHLGEFFYLDHIYRIRIVEDTSDPLLINVLVFPCAKQHPTLRQPMKKRILGHGRYSRLAVYTCNPLDKLAPLLATLSKATFEAGYYWLENRVHEHLGTILRSEDFSKSLAEDMGRVVRTLVKEHLADNIWFMVSAGDSSMLAMDARKRWHAMKTLAKERRRNGHSPLEQLSALSTTVLPFNQTLTYKALLGDGTVKSKFIDAPYAKPATPFMHALRTAFESEVASVNVITPDAELIVAIGCPESLGDEVKKHLTELRAGVERVVQGRARDFKQCLKSAKVYSTTASLRFEAEKVAGAFTRSLINTISTSPKLVFISYSHADELHKEKIEKHLSPLIRAQQIEVFSDRGIQPGGKWESEISEQLIRSNIVLVLISADFIASDYCYEREMSESLRRHQRGDVVVIPVFLRPCHHQNLPISEIQGVPREAVPIEKLSCPDEGYLQVVEAVQEACNG
ncbi:MAG TPA: toll/interleukin-1 receptor domain-containing protein [Pyrinomonadaceae bacterium]|nr:toll/interleukin-1 receptor domain-containing protein [Pyrinomonadaceae bacterium]